MKRRQALKSLGNACLAPVILNPVFAKPDENIFDLPLDEDNSKFVEFNKPLTCIIIGAGNRGWVYSRYTTNFPEQMKIVGIAEPVKIRQVKFKKAYDLDDSNIFNTWEHVFERPKFADFVIVSTIDKYHYGAAMAALEMGYHVLLEKAIAQTWEECQNILKQAEKYDRIIGICHVLRYSPYYKKIYQLIHSAEIGDIVSVQHLEPIGNVHFSHSFVRGNWGNEKESTPILISKSFHDLDIIYWLLGKRCSKVSSFGGLHHFNSKNVPEGSTKRCTGGCRIEKSCPYSALRLYYNERIWGVSHLIDLQPWDERKVMKALEEGPYGRCVFQSDNDVADHQIVNMEFENDVTVAFSMEGHTSYEGRRTRIMGTSGDIVGDGRTLTVSDFSKRDAITYQDKEMTDEFEGGGHGGGDYRLVRDFLQAIYQEDDSLLTSTIADSMESHYIGFKAEESRHKGGEVMNL
jgi:predicted dehydrogenase